MQGTPGTQSGIGPAAVADWWLTNLLVEEEVAAAAPATTTNKAKMRMASFIISNPFRLGLAKIHFFACNNYRAILSLSTFISCT